MDRRVRSRAGMLCSLSISSTPDPEGLGRRGEDRTPDLGLVRAGLPPTMTGSYNAVAVSRCHLGNAAPYAVGGGGGAGAAAGASAAPPGAAVGAAAACASAVFFCAAAAT